MIFQSLIKKKEQGCGFGADEEGYYECGKDIGDNGEITYCDSCSAQLSLLKTLQKEVEEVLDKLSYSFEIRDALKNVGVKE